MSTQTVDAREKIDILESDVKELKERMESSQYYNRNLTKVDDLTIAEINLLKKKIEDKISEIISKFNNETGLKIIKVHLLEIIKRWSESDGQHFNKQIISIELDKLF